MTSKNYLPPIPPALADVAYIDAPTIASAAGLSLSAWHERVRLGQAPQPVIRQPKFSRWLLADVRAWLIESAMARSIGTGAAGKAKARRPSAAAAKPAEVPNAQARSGRRASQAAKGR